MAKTKRYPRARSPLHAMFLTNQGQPVRKPVHNDIVGPATPLRVIAALRKRYLFNDELTAKVFHLLNIACSGKAIKYGDRVAMLPVGQGRVIVQISRQRRNANYSVGTSTAKVGINATPSARCQMALMAADAMPLIETHSGAKRIDNSSHCA